MLCGQVFERFVAKCPVTIMVRGLMERAFRPEALDQLFLDTAQRQYTKELLFSTTVELLATVVCRIHPSVHAAYQDRQEDLPVSVRSLYDKLAATETGLSEALVRHSAAQLQPILPLLRATLPPYVPGYQTKILDGNHLAASQRRLKPLRDVAAGALPGQTLVVLEPERQLATDVFCGEDAHAQERSLRPRLLDRVAAKDLWIADRNFCTTAFLFGLANKKAAFLIRQHGSTLSWEKESRRKRLGRIAEGVVYQQRLWLKDAAGHELQVRRVTLVLDQPTCDGETEIHLITNLPSRVSGKRVAEVYRKRWTIEQLFLNLTTVLQCELNTLPYPKAALFGFCVALAAGNLLGTAKGSLRAAFGAEAVEEVSDYHLATQVAGTYQGMMIALPEEDWRGLAELAVEAFAQWLLGLARRVNLRRFRKQRRGPKKPRPRRTRFARKKHIATSRLLDGYYDTK
jgi:hypothetical protein